MLDGRSQPNDAAAPAGAGLGLPTATPRQHLLFYVAIPLAIGLLFGWMKAGRTGEWPLAYAIGFWVCNVWISWLICDLGARVAAVMLRPWRVPLWTVLVLGFAMVQGLNYPVNRGIADLFQSHLVPYAVHRPLPQITWFAVFKSVLPGLLLWLGINLALHRWIGMPRYGFAAPGGTPAPGTAPAAAAATGDDARPIAPDPPAMPLAPIAAGMAGVSLATDARAASPLLARLPAKLGRRLRAIAAEEHYLRVHTDQGSALVLYRMSDAVRELEGWPGLQVHRSWWVALDAIERVERAQGQMTLVLAGGLRVPVSRSYRKAVEDRALAGRAVATLGA